MNYYEFLMNVDINDMSSFCIINRETQKICNNKWFWENYFDNANLPIINYENNSHDWIKEFMSVVNAEKKTDEILKYLTRPGKKSTYIYFYLDNFNNYDEIPFLPKKLKRKIADNLIRNPSINMPVELRFLHYKGEYSIVYINGKDYTFNQALASININVNNVKILLFDLFYFYYKNNIPIHIASGEVKKTALYPNIFKDAIDYPFHIRQKPMKILRYEDL
jgi:hypothetical protein